MKLAEKFPNLAEFEILLEDAELNANGRWEERFIETLREHYLDYAEDMRITEAQVQRLEAIRLGVSSTKHVRF